MSEEVEQPIVLQHHLKTEPIEGSPSGLKNDIHERPQSPEANCAICLEGFNNKSFTNSCLHQFCYLCLREWSKIKPECPLCKQRFETIIHNIRSPGDYDEYHVETRDPFENVIINLAPRFSYSNTLDFRERNLHAREMFERYVQVPTFSSMLFIRPHRGNVVPPPSSTLDNYFSFSDVGPNVTVRRDVYRHNRWVRPLNTSRFRESSPEFYRSNSAQTHRLVPWLYRELHVLLDVSIDPNIILQDILHLVTLYPIRSRPFREALLPAMGNHTDHFIHEFYNFATSPHDLHSYDLVAEYDTGSSRPVRCSPLRFNFPSDESDDSDVEVVHPTRPKVEPLRDQLSNQCGLDLTNRPGPSSGVPFPPSAASDVVIEISDSTSSDSEVEIIHVRPPTPVIITINSSDSEDEVLEVTNVETTAEPIAEVEELSDLIIDDANMTFPLLPSTSHESTSSWPMKQDSRRMGLIRSSLRRSRSSSSSSSHDSVPKKRRKKKPIRRIQSPSTSSTESNSSSTPSSSSSQSDSDSAYKKSRSSRHVSKKRKRTSADMRKEKRLQRMHKQLPEDDDMSSSDDEYKSPRFLRSVVKRVEQARANLMKRSCRQHK